MEERAPYGQEREIESKKELMAKACSKDLLKALEKYNLEVWIEAMIMSLKTALTATISPYVQKIVLSQISQKLINYAEKL